MLQKQFSLALAILVATVGASRLATAAAEMSDAEAWQSLPKYEYGQDMAALLTIDRAVIKAMVAPETRAACAARLAGLLADGHATPAAREYICFQLRQIGTPAQVPVLAEMLQEPETAQTARYALEQIPGDEASAALRKGLETLKGKWLLGVIDSLAVRKDMTAVPALERLADDQDQEVAAAALVALGRIGGDRAFAFLIARAEKAPVPMPRPLAVAILRQTQAMAEAGNRQSAMAIFDKLSQVGQPQGIRRAALEGLLRAQGEKADATILAWFTDKDPERRLVAAGHLNELRREQIAGLRARLTELPEGNRLAVVETATTRLGQAMLPVAISMVKGDKPELRLAGLRCLGLLGDKSVIPLLLDQLSDDEPVRETAQGALAQLPRADVVPVLLEALNARPAVRPSVIGVLTLLHCREAIDPLIELAAQANPDVYGPALEGIAQIAAPHDALVSVIAAPDDTDVPRLVQLLLRVEPGRHRDKVEQIGRAHV
jgi:HEAT repeat protein